MFRTFHAKNGDLCTHFCTTGHLGAKGIKGQDGNVIPGRRYQEARYIGHHGCEYTQKWFSVTRTSASMYLSSEYGAKQKAKAATE